MQKKLTAKEVADCLRVGVNSVYRWVRKGVLPCQRPGLRPVLFDEKEIEEFLRRKTEKVQTPNK